MDWVSFSIVVMGGGGFLTALIGILTGAGGGENHHQNQQSRKQCPSGLCHNDSPSYVGSGISMDVIKPDISEENNEQGLESLPVWCVGLQHISHIVLYKLS